MLNILLSGLEQTAPLILAALAGLFSERAGIMNIALEGKMLAAACTLGLVGIATGNPFLGLLAAILAATLISLAHGVLTQTYKIDHIVSGMALNALALGGTRFAYAQFADRNYSGEVPNFPEWVYWTLAAIAPLVVALFLRDTRGGLRLLAVGNDPDKAREAGVDPIRVRYLALLGCGLLCGLAGALVITKTGRYSDEMTAGSGFIAIAALVVGGWRPLPTLGACFFFGICQAAQQKLQGGAGFLSAIPAQYWNTLPYVATIIALALLGGKWKAPAGMGKQ